MSTPRILLVSVSRDPEREDDARALAAAVREQGLEAILALPGEAAAGDGERAIPPVGMRPGVRDAATYAALVALLTSTKPALVHALHGRALPSVLAAAEVVKTPMRVATVSRGPGAIGPEGARRAAARLPRALRAAAEAAPARVFRQVDRVITTSRETERAWVESGWVPATRLRGLEVGLGVRVEDWVDEGPPAARRRSARARLSAAEARHVICSDLRGASRSARERYRAFGRQLREHTRWFTRGGEGLGVAVDAARWRDAVVASDLVVQLECGDEPARAVARAALARVPALAWSSGPHRAVIRDGETGSLIGSNDALPSALRLWLDDPVRREHAGAVARRWALRRCDRDLALQRVLGWYDELWRSAIASPAVIDGSGRFAADTASDNARRVRDLLG